MSWEYYVLYSAERKLELEIRHHERWGWEYNWKNEGGKDRWAKFEDKMIPEIEPNLKKYGYKMPPHYLHSEDDYDLALEKAATLMDSKPGSIQEHELLRWVDAIEEYEDKYYPIDEPDSEPKQQMLL